MKRKFLIFGFWVAIGVVVTAIMVLVISKPHENAKYNGYLNVLNWTSYIPNEIIHDFENEYNIKVNYNTYSSNEELLAKITSSNEGTYDVIFPSDYMVELMAYRDMLEPINIGEFTNLRQLDTRFLHQKYDPENTYSLPFLMATTMIAYDTQKFGDVDSYRELFGPEFKDSLILVDDQRIVIGAMLNTLGYSINDTNERHLEESLELFNKLRPNIKAFDSDSPKTFLITREADAGIIWSAEAILAQEYRPELAMVYPEEGFVISVDNYCITKDSKNQDNAYLFIDYLMRDDVAKRIVETYPYYSPNLSAGTLSDEELNEIFTRGSYVENLGDNLKKFDKLWARYK